MELEDMHHFEILGAPGDDDTDFFLSCLRCPDWTDWVSTDPTIADLPVTLADVVARADKHVEKVHR